MTLALVLAYSVAETFGSESGGVLAQWLWALTHNPVVSASLSLAYLAVGAHLAVGLAFAVVYARFLEPVLDGPGWSRGVRFALLPWALSVLVLLPALGGGFLGLGLGAGPLPILGNLILHLVYGAVLGWTYSLGTTWQEEGGYAARGGLDLQERNLALGIVFGALVGGLFGWLIGVVTASGGEGAFAAEGAYALAGALFGSASGAILGPLLGMARRA
jgi:hypothetical protein